MITMMNWVRNPKLMNAGRRKPYLDPNLVSNVSSRQYRLLSDENFDYVVREKNKHFREFAKNDYFTQSLQSGIDAKYSGLIMGKDISGDRTMSSLWLNITVTSTVKHEEFSGGSYYKRIRADPSMSTTL